MRERLCLTPSEIAELVHFLHPIPISRGLHRSYVARTNPGWDWDTLYGALRASGVLIRNNRGHPPFFCDARLRLLEVGRDQSFFGVWDFRLRPD